MPSPGGGFGITCASQIIGLSLAVIQLGICSIAFGSTVQTHFTPTPKVAVCLDDPAAIDPRLKILPKEWPSGEVFHDRNHRKWARVMQSEHSVDSFP
ncbi:hypothetical protein BD779DRAFT_541419 [Infundibulicybe gibba]|nr:hypothetical protein BD779DRAFT_541419 [Infundibulicybe gibba]